MANFTRGPALIHERSQEYGSCSDDGMREYSVSYSVMLTGRKQGQTYEYSNLCYVHKMEDAGLIAAAFNSATKVEEMGFDGQKAIEELPNMVGALLECEVLLDNYPLIRRMVKDILIKVKEKDNG